jgi:hypothetical protein
MAVIPSRDANHWSKHDIRQEQHNIYQEPGKSLQQQLHHRKEPGFSSGKIPTFSKIHFYRGQPVILLERLTSVDKRHNFKCYLLIQSFAQEMREEHQYKKTLSQCFSHLMSKRLLGGFRLHNEHTNYASNYQQRTNTKGRIATNMMGTCVRRGCQQNTTRNETDNTNTDDSIVNHRILH